MANYSQGAGMLMGHVGGAIGTVDSTINAGASVGTVSFAKAKRNRTGGWQASVRQSETNLESRVQIGLVAFMEICTVTPLGRLTVPTILYSP